IGALSRNPYTLHRALALKVPTPVRRGQIDIGPCGDDLVAVDQEPVAVLYQLEVDGAGDAGPLVEFAQVSGERRVVVDLPEVALECVMVADVEPHERGERAPVSFGQPLAAKVSMGREVRLHHVERGENLAHGFF